MVSSLGESSAIEPPLPPFSTPVARPLIVLGKHPTLPSASDLGEGERGESGGHLKVKGVC